MKKLVTLVAMAMLFVPVTASAFEVVIPYFLDGGRIIATEGTTIKGGAAFITMVNLTNDTLTLGVVYVDTFGVNSTPSDNTFELNPGAANGFRPVATDIGMEDDTIPGALASVGGTPTSFARDANGNGGRGGLRLVLAPPNGVGTVEDYPDFANWGPMPFAALLNQYIFYDWALAGAGMEAGFVTKNLE